MRQWCGQVPATAEIAGGSGPTDPTVATAPLGQTRSVLRTVAVEGYRSLRSVHLPLGVLTVVSGANGTGKSSVYRVLGLLAAAARADLVPALAAQGGIESVLWAGPERLSGAMRRGEHAVTGTVRTGPVALRIGFASDDLSYAADLGLPQPSAPPSLFAHDPEVKSEAIWSGPTLRPSTLLTERRGPLVRFRRDDGGWEPLPGRLASWDSILSQVADPRAAPDVLAVREQLRSWRFYDQIRTDPGSPARAPGVGTRTTALAADGRDLPAALGTIREIGDVAALDAAVEAAFPGSTVEVGAQDDGTLSLSLRQAGLLRPLRAGELSDGTLRYLAWTAALLSPRPPSLLVLNEPENSLHPDLLPGLAGLVVDAAARGQVVVVTHHAVLLDALRRSASRALDERSFQDVTLIKDLGETRIDGRDPLEATGWTWPKR